MKHFTALYSMPVEGLEAWMKKPESERKEAEAKMRTEWDAWLAAHKGAVLKTIALGATKRVSDKGVESTKNGLMLSSYVEAETLEDAAEIFKDHPHVSIPGAIIEVMETRDL